MKYKNYPRITWILVTIAFVVLLVWGQGTSPNERYMVRAIILEQADGEYRVGALYQDPEAAANSADALAPFKLARGQGVNLAAAFQSLEQRVSQTLSYQMSDYLLLCDGCEKEMVEEYAQQVQLTQRGRYAAYLYVFAQDLETLEKKILEDQMAAQSLFDGLEQNGMPEARLYEITEQTVVIPFLSMEEDGALAPIETLYLLSKQGGTLYDETQTQLYQLLSGAAGQVDFLVGGTAFTIRARVLSHGEPLVGVSDCCVLPAMSHTHDSTQANPQMNATSGQKKLPTLSVYALVADTTDSSPAALRQMASYLTKCANARPEILSQIETRAVEIHLYSLENLC